MTTPYQSKYWGHALNLKGPRKRREELLGKHDEYLAEIVGKLRELMSKPNPSPRKVRRMGFNREEEDGIEEPPPPKKPAGKKKSKGRGEKK